MVGKNIEELPPLIIGGAVFNTQYNSDPHNISVSNILDVAFSKGLNAIDTSPYYGPSEEIYGKALREISSKWDRESYFICTKAGRIKLDDFDYSRAWVRKSVLRSLDRLGTSYIDLIYMHDIEFVEESQILEALRELKLMKDEGIINNIGISGYPVDFLYKVAKQCVDDQDIGSLDVIMSYSNGCIQNEKLFGYYDRFIGECGLKKVLNGSILSMSLLRSGATHDFHPASKGLKDKMQEVAQGLKPVELADLATKFAYKRWLFDTNKANELGSAPSLQPNSKCSIVLGVSNVEELEAAIKNYTEVKERIYENENEKLFSKVQKELGEHLNETWRSGIHRDLD